MSKPFTYWVRLALVATLCTLVTFSPVSAGRLMDRLLHRDNCKVAVKDCCEQPAPCEPSCFTVPAAQCLVEQAPIAAGNCHSAVVESITCDVPPPCGYDSVAPTKVHSVPIAPTSKQPAPVVDHAAPVIEKTAPVIVKPAPVVEKPAPVVEKPAPVVEQPAPVVEQPALAPSLPTLTAPNPFDAAPSKSTDLDIFGDEPAVKRSAAESVSDPTVIDKPTVEPEMPSAAAKNELDDLFGNPATKPAPKIDDIFSIDPDPKSAVPQENVPPSVVAPPTKSLDTELDDLFSDKPAKPVAENPSKETHGKPITAEIDTQPELPVGNTTSSVSSDDAILDSLFGERSASGQSSATPKAPEVAQPKSVEPEIVPPAKEKEVDELEALFGVSAFAAPASFQGAEYRVWVDNSGAYQVKARVAVIYADRIKLLKENGKFSTVPLARLSEADFQYVSWVASNLSSDQTARMVKTKSPAADPGVDR